MARTVKDPEERRRELLACAMRLFAEKGYDNVSVRAVAREAGVASGLAYHYFDSKQALFDAAIEEYARQCAERFCSIFSDRSLSLDEQLDLAFDLGGVSVCRFLPCERARCASRAALSRYLRSGAAQPDRRARARCGPTASSASRRREATTTTCPP